jgi:glycosyltransferase involved in cell wall biosynthesis
VSLRLLVAIPCLNEALTITNVVLDVPRMIPGIDHVDVLVIDDGSSDETGGLAKDAGAIVLRHPSNRGVGRAFRTAIDYAIDQHYDLMVNIDGDGQFNPRDVEKLVQPILSGKCEVTTASRFLDKMITPSMPEVKRLGNHVMSYFISGLVGKQYRDVSCGFRCFSRDALLQLNLHGAFTYTHETFLNLALKNVSIQEVPIEVKYFEGRVSRVAGSIPRYALNALKIILRTYRDYYPLRFFWGIAVILAVPAIVFGALFLWHYLTTGAFRGFLFAAFTSAFFAVMAMAFALIGVIADMLDRLRLNQERILYLLRSNAPNRQQE